MTTRSPSGPSAALSPRALARSLVRLGVSAGTPLMVHASLRRLGPVEGRADGVLDAIRLALGSDGTMLMMIAADGDEPFDRRTTQADKDNGVLAEVFRTRSGVQVNDHPACRFAAWGPAARDLLEPQPLHDYFGRGSPLERLCQRGGAVLRLGADSDTVTLTHLAEYLADIARKASVETRYVRADRGEILVRSLDDTHGIADWAGGDYFSQILTDFVGADAAMTGQVGGCVAELFDARTFVEFAKGWMERELGLPG